MFTHLSCPWTHSNNTNNVQILFTLGVTRIWCRPKEMVDQAGRETDYHKMLSQSAITKLWNFPAEQAIQRTTSQRSSEVASFTNSDARSKFWYV